MGKEAARRAAVVAGVRAERSSWGLVSARRCIVGGAIEKRMVRTGEAGRFVGQKFGSRSLLMWEVKRSQMLSHNNMRDGLSGPFSDSVMTKIAIQNVKMFKHQNVKTTKHQTLFFFSDVTRIS